MISLNADESRVLGVLVEKATTTPEQYPLSLNAITNGSNQKNNRDPVRSMTENECFDATESLRAKSLVMRVDQMGSRVSKFRHQAGEVLHLRTTELAILAELLLRGPQTIGEIRGRASRMAPLESLEAAQALVHGMMTRPEPLLRELPPLPGSRAVRYVQLLCAELHPIDSTVNASATNTPQTTSSSSLADRVSQLENEVAQLREELAKLRQDLGA
jgi:uncharacterized protein YceH (UPF0502 family)